MSSHGFFLTPPSNTGQEHRKHPNVLKVITVCQHRFTEYMFAVCSMLSLVFGAYPWIILKLVSLLECCHVIHFDNDCYHNAVESCLVLSLNDYGGLLGLFAGSLELPLIRGRMHQSARECTNYSDIGIKLV